MGGNIVDAIDGGYEMSGHFFHFADQNWDWFISLWGLAPHNGV